MQIILIFVAMNKKYMDRGERKAYCDRIAIARKKIESIYKNGEHGRVPMVALATPRMIRAKPGWKKKLSETWHSRIIYPEMVELIEKIAADV